mmetsp:Transcript_22043/g.32853  ORF Transcript_22043/g.32853 Transcript_22043/m.32853 type:complete len:504 (+) Transcript_22043:69-1580(+)
MRRSDIKSPRNGMHRSTSQQSLIDDESVTYKLDASSSSQQPYPGTTSDIGDFYRIKYLQIQEVNSTLTKQIEQLTLENKLLTKSLSEHQDALGLCRARLESLGDTVLEASGTTIPPVASNIEEKITSGDSISSLVPEPKRKSRFSCRSTLRGHQGAVYCVKFSPKGDLIATGSLDKSVCLWNMRGSKQKSKIGFLKQRMPGHEINVTTLAWSGETWLLSGSYDHSVRLWDVKTGKCEQQFDVTGMVQSVVWASDGAATKSRNGTLSDHGGWGENVFYTACSRAKIYGFDRRVGTKCCQELGLKGSEAMVTSLRIPLESDFSCLASADDTGVVRTWSLRTGRCIKEWSCGRDKHAISHLSGIRDKTTRLLGVNSYDNVLRIYSLPPAIRTGEVKHLCSLEGHQNANWPIRSSMKRMRPPESKEKKSDSKDLHTFVATGSADGRIYVFDLDEGEPQGSVSPKSMSKVFDILSGHDGRVYDVDFHPTSSILATSSDDATIKLWAME